MLQHLDIKLANCAGCGEDLLGKNPRFHKIPREYKRLTRIHSWIKDTKRPLADHKRPYCKSCALLTRMIEKEKDEIPGRFTLQSAKIAS
jgi:hypothetical protein